MGDTNSKLDKAFVHNLDKQQQPQHQLKQNLSKNQISSSSSSSTTSISQLSSNIASTSSSSFSPQTITNTSIAPLQTTSSSPSPPFSLLSRKANLSASQVTQISDPSLLLSQATASTTSVSGLIQNHGLEKLSISSADSSSVPNSPPPNYEELISNDVFDTNLPSQNNANCFDNKMYFQRIYNLSLNNSRGLNENTAKQHQQAINLSPHQKQQVQYDSSQAPSPTSIFTASSTIGAASRILNKDTNIFSFPELNDSNKNRLDELKYASSSLSNISADRKHIFSPLPPPTPQRPQLPPPTDAHQSRQQNFASASFHSLSLPPPRQPPPHPPTDAPRIQPLYHSSTASFHSIGVPPPSEVPRAPLQPPALPPRPKKNVKN